MLTLCSAFSVLTCVVASTFKVHQVPLSPGSFPRNYGAYDDGLFQPVEKLSVLSESGFTTLRHPFFPHHSVRMKKSSFCDETVKSYTGYIDIEARHIFFYFFESRNNPDKDDVLFWTNGGPGCSSSIGLFMELGPCRVDANGTKFHPEAWNSNANLLFVDQPIGVGYSYADYGETVSSTEEAAKDIAAFTAIFFENFNQFKGRGFHMSGESYAGRYLPLFASEIYDQNVKLVEAGLTPINLTSVMIGNGLTDFLTMYESYHEVTCTAAIVPPIFNAQTCVEMKRKLPRCLKWMKESCFDQFDEINCGASASFCNATLLVPYFELGMNPYDITRKCNEGQGDICYAEVDYIEAYLSREDVRSMLGVDSALPSQYSTCSDTVGHAFGLHLDELRPTYLYVAALLERGVKVLIYVGKNDFVCNYKGNEAWTLKMEWSNQDEYRKQLLRDWTLEGKKAGVTRSAGGLTFATIEGAGHLSPYDNPKETLELVNRWLAGKDL